MRSWAAFLLPSLLLAGDPLLDLPVLPHPQPQPVVAPRAKDQLAPGLRLERGRQVEIDGLLHIDRGPPEGLEVLACLQGGKTHEALIHLGLAQGSLVKAAVLAAFGWPDGMPAKELSGIPARGIPARLRVAWTDAAGREVQIDASCLVRDRVTDQAYPALPWIWTGSRFETIRQATPEGGVVAREQFMLDVTRSLVVNYDEPDALFASPFPGANADQRFEANSRIAPPKGTPVRLIIEPADLPLRLELAADGSLSQGAGPLDDAALVALLAAVPADAALRAIAVHPVGEVDRQVDAAVRLRLLTLAAQAKTWLVPVFTVR